MADRLILVGVTSMQIDRHLAEQQTVRSCQLYLLVILLWHDANETSVLMNKKTNVYH